MIDSVEIEVVGSVLVTHPGTCCLTQEGELSFSTPAAGTPHQVKTELDALPQAELAFQLYRGEAGGFLAADHFNSILASLAWVPDPLVGAIMKILQNILQLV